MTPYWHPFPDRGTWQTHMTLQGWAPLRTITYDGLFNAGLKLGFGVGVRPGYGNEEPSGAVHRIGSDPRPFGSSFGWDDLSDDILVRIHKRLSEP